jgi:hypothetical protein
MAAMTWLVEGRFFKDSDGNLRLLWDDVEPQHRWRRSIVKTVSKGNLLWMKNFPSSGLDSSMIRGNDDSYILCCGMLNKIDREGNLLWSQNVTIDVPTGLYAPPTTLVAQTSDGGYAVAGTVQSIPSNPQDMTSYVWLGKIDAEGNPAKFVPEFPVGAALGFAVWVFLVAVVFK